MSISSSTEAALFYLSKKVTINEDLKEGSHLRKEILGGKDFICRGTHKEGSVRKPM
jgi:hypothetical protein